jgi:flagellar hook-associated protein 3 FlgL
VINPLDSQSQRFLGDLQRIQDRMDRAQRQVTTGLRVQQVSDDPDVVPELLRTRTSLDSVEQLKTNLGRVQLEIDTAEKSMQTAVSLFERARTLGAQGATGTASAATRSQLADQVGLALEQLVGLTRTTVEGRYIFSGDTDQVPPYSIDMSLSPPVSGYAGSGVSRLVEHPNGTTFSIARTAQEIFDSTAPETNVFGAMTELRDALKADDGAAIEAALGKFTPAGSYLNQQLAYYGTAQSRIGEAQDYADRQILGFKTQLAQLEEADMAESIVEFQNAKYNQEAALQVRGQAPRRSLFDYLG